MRIRPIWLMAGAMTLGAGCANNPAEPKLACDGNPKCEAHPTPITPSTLEPVVTTTTPGSPVTCRIRISARCDRN